MGMKRANGTGSVYKLKKNLHNPFKAVITIGWTDDGKRIRKCLGYFAKSKEAWDALAAYWHDPDSFDNKEVTFAQAWEWMIEEKKRKGVDIKKGKFAASKAKVKPLWNMPIQQIRLAHLQAIFDTYKNLGRSSHENLLKAINGTFKEAIKNDVINKNYASMVTIPPVKKSTMHIPFSAAEMEILWQHTDIKLVRVLLIYIYTGMRPVELYEINIDDVHIKERYMVGGVKTAAGKNRIIPIAKCILPFVSEIYSLARFSKSSTVLPAGYIPVRIDRNLRALCDDLGIREHKRHDTRHTFITMAENHKMDEHILKDIVGHSHSGDVTHEVYTHKNTSQLIEAVDDLPTKFTSQNVATV
ncbi:tyrosine-type recombinase/integrase [uncultured Megasphaera sp.]|jgi:integrase|uniref:tyrosine-type recombinase/integrase n=1 Tax=uncultured Megasphaera sp. TaxID=165188 RepID=UPI00258518D6|nr:tyrosine-type recombinase/integrase [uncultured Megasphaera sp.]